MIVQCAWCRKQIAVVPPLENKAVSHGICPECKVKVEEKWAEHQQVKREAEHE